MANITTITSPHFDEMEDLWISFRLTGEGGEPFLEAFLKQRPKEQSVDFTNRKEITYIPSFSKAAVKQVDNSLSQRMTSVRRIGGSEKYKRAVLGLDKGVDRSKRSMNSFFTTRVIPELTMMGEVGILIDAPNITPFTLQDEIDISPYLYTYTVENIRAWATVPEDPTKYSRLLLRDNIQVFDEDFGLATNTEERYRLYELNDNDTVTLTLYDSQGEETETAELDIPEIPFVLLAISSSLLTDIYRHQISLLNLGSADMKYAWEGNMIFLAEKYNPNSSDIHFRNRVDNDESSTSGTATEAITKDNVTRHIGVDRSALVPKDLEYPTYIAPPPGPLQVSIQKQEQVKDQIGEILNQTLRTVTSRSSSATSKQVDERKEEDGLKAVGSELEYGENRIAAIWAMYENTKDIAEVKYPDSYQYLSSEDRRKQVQDLAQLMLFTPSRDAQRQIAKNIIMLLVGHTAKEEELKVMFQQIDDAKGTIADPEIIAKLVEMDLIDTETASIQIGFSKEVAQKAKAERIERARDTALAQSVNNGARGNDALSVNPEQEANQEKIDAQSS